MNEIWPKVRLGDVCEFRRGLTYSKGDEVEVSSNVVLRSNNVDLDTGLMVYDELKYISNDFEIPDDKRVVVDSVLMCMANGSKAHLGKVGYIEKDLGYAFGGFMGLLVPKGVDGKYLYWVLSSASFKKLIQGLTAGANINNLRFAAIKEFEIPLPPLAEQRKIVEKVEKALKRVDALKAQFERMEKSAADYFKAALAETFAAVKGEKVKLGDVCEIDGHLVTDYKKYANHPHIGIDSIEKETGYLSGYRTVAEDGVKSGKYFFTSSHIIYSKIRPYLNKVALPDFDGLCSADSYPILPSERCDRRWLAYKLRSKAFLDYVIPLSARAGMPKVNREQLLAYEFVLPEKSGQEAAADHLDAAKSKSERMVAAARRGIEICGKMRKAILAEAFQ